MAKILILNAAPRKNGNTAELVRAFTEGALEGRNEVREVYLAGQNIRPCLGCTACHRNGGTCIQQDDMHLVYDGMEWADVIVFASPIYFNSVTGQLKQVNDRMFAFWNKHYLLGKNPPAKQSVLILSSAAQAVERAVGWYSFFEEYGGWENLGIINGAGSSLGLGKAEDPAAASQARALGQSIH